MNSVLPHHPAKTLQSLPITMAELELRAFFTAIFDLFNKEQAEFAAEVWINELNQSKEFPLSVGACRSITVKAAARLASHLNALPTEFSNA